jgi:hypothetical protein
MSAKSPNVEPRAGDFGEPVRIIEVTPLVVPVPETYPDIDPAEIPDAPAVPEREPEKVPS